MGGRRGTGHLVREDYLNRQRRFYFRKRSSVKGDPHFTCHTRSPVTGLLSVGRQINRVPRHRINTCLLSCGSRAAHKITLTRLISSTSIPTSKTTFSRPRRGLIGLITNALCGYPSACCGPGPRLSLSQRSSSVIRISRTLTWLLGTHPHTAVSSHCESWRNCLRLHMLRPAERTERPSCTFQEVQLPTDLSITIPPYPLPLAARSRAPCHRHLPTSPSPFRPFLLLFVTRL